MKIDGSLVTGNSSMPQNNIAGDSVIKGLQKQIEQIKQKINELPNQELTDEEKLKKKQEYQDQIQQLNTQINQRMMELRNKQQEEKEVESKPTTIESTGRTYGLNSETINTLTSVSASLKNIKTLDSVEISFEGKKRILKAQIKMDGERGENTLKKSAELAKVEEKINNVKFGKTNELNKANVKLNEKKNEEENKDKEELNNKPYSLTPDF